MLFLPSSDVCVRNFLYPFCTLIKLYCTKALSDQASSLAPDLILLIRKPRIPVSFHGPETTFQYHFNAESKEELNSFLMKVKEESEKAGLKLKIQKSKIMPSSPITSWEIDGETEETVADFIIGVSKITANGDCSREIKRCLLLGSKAMTNLESMLKNRHIILLTKVRIVKATVFPVVVYRCESWTIKKAEHQRINAFLL